MGDRTSCADQSLDPMAPLTVSLLPADVLQVILSSVPLLRRVVCRRVCKLWKNVVDTRFKLPEFLTASRCDLVPLLSQDEVPVGSYKAGDDQPEAILCTVNSRWLYCLTTTEKRKAVPVDRPLDSLLVKQNYQVLWFKGSAYHVHWCLNISASAASSQLVVSQESSNPDHALRMCIFHDQLDPAGLISLTKDQHARVLKLGTELAQMSPVATVSDASRYRNWLMISTVIPGAAGPFYLMDLSKEDAPLIRRDMMDFDKLHKRYIYISTRFILGTPYCHYQSYYGTSSAFLVNGITGEVIALSSAIFTVCFIEGEYAFLVQYHAKDASLSFHDLLNHGKEIKRIGLFYVHRDSPMELSSDSSATTATNSWRCLCCEETNPMSSSTCNTCLISRPSTAEKRSKAEFVQFNTLLFDGSSFIFSTSAPTIVKRGVFV